MKSPSVCAIIVLIGLTVSLSAFGQQATNQPAVIKTNFVANARLSSEEVKQVLEVARECGIATPGEVRTFVWIHSDERGISVTSAERIDGRNTYFEAIEINKDSWWKDWVLGKGLKRVGEFWANPAERYRTCYRKYEFRSEAVQVMIANEIDADLADKAIGLIAKSKVRFEADPVRFDFEKLTDAKPTILRMSRYSHDYELEMHKPNKKVHDVRFRFEKDEMVINGAAEIFP